MDRVRHVRPATKATFRASVLAAAAGAVVLVPQFARAATESENFTVAPSDWQSLNTNVSGANYGFSNTNNTGQSPAGEAGGTFARSADRGYYADTTVGTLTQDDFIHGEGEFSFGNGATGNTDFIFGHQNTSTLGITFNTLGIGIFEGDEGGTAADGFRFAAQFYNDAGSDVHGVRTFFPNGQYKFTYDWNPNTEVLTAVLRDTAGTALFTDTASAPGSTFNFNAMGFVSGINGSSPNPGQSYDIFVDAATYTIGQAANQNFDTSPRNWYKQGGVGPGNYGFSNTDNTGQESGAGEAGGLINRDHIRRGYTDGTVGQVTQASPFSASGEFSWGNAQNQNTEVFIAHYAQDQLDGVNEGDSTSPTHGGHNMAGLYVLDESFGSVRVRARVYTKDGIRRDGTDFSVPVGQYKFDYSYDPNSLTLTVRILQQDGATVFGTSSVVLDPADQFSLDAFGLTTGFTGTPGEPPQSFDLFMDGLTYTINPGTKWNTDGNSSWSAASWSHGVPNAVGAVANFGDAISGNVTVTNDSANTVGTINFDDNNSYTIDGTSPLNIANTGIGGSLNVINGNHTINAPVAPAGNLVVNVAPNSTLTVSNLQPTVGEVIKNGDGKWAVNNVQAASLAVSGGVVELIPGSAVASKVSNLIVNTGGRLDMKDNKLIVAAADLNGDTVPDDQTGTWDGSAYTGVSGLVDRGRGDAGNALWNGATGIITSDTRAINNGDLLSIGVAKVGNVRPVADNATTTFAGQTVLGLDTIAMVTWGGDANLDGKINIDDYGRIDGNVGQSGSVFGWEKGDFNYDGKINIDDYGIIDGNINRQGTAFSTAAPLEGVGAVPEPTALLLAGPAALGALLRRRRR